MTARVPSSRCASQFSPPRLSDSDEASFLTEKCHLEPQVVAAYRHGRLNEKELAEVHSHLSVCRECREMVAELVRSENSVPRDDNGNREH
jgi:hypothetical protein